MASGAGLAIDAIKKLRANRALLRKKGPFQILKENQLVKPKGKEYVFKQMTPNERRAFQEKVRGYKIQEKKRLILISALTLGIALIFTLLLLN